jgi:outer membrane protein OmpA-like peptidoglycan-associated protein
MKKVRWVIFITVIVCGYLNTLAAATPSHSYSPVNQENTTRKIFQDTLIRTHLYFDHDQKHIDSTYRDNQKTIDTILEAFATTGENSLRRMSTIIIEGTASPIGDYWYNQRLSKRRAQVAGQFLHSLHELENANIEIKGIGEDWELFEEEVIRNYNRPNKEELLSIIRSDASTWEKELRIRNMDSDENTWQYIVCNCMRDSRRVKILIVTDVTREHLPQSRIKTFTAQAQCGEFSTPVIGKPIIRSAKIHPTANSMQSPVFAIRSNLLLPLLNIGAEVPLGNNWSIGADYYYPWMWPDKSNKDCFELLGWSLEGRYWFGRDRKPEDRLKGHSVALYGAGGYYDFEKDYRGMQGEFLSTGLDYTYALGVGPRSRVHFEFTIAVGYIHSVGRTYDVFSEGGDLIPDGNRHTFQYFGPTKAAVSLVIPIFKKEGKR